VTDSQDKGMEGVTVVFTEKEVTTFKQTLTSKEDGNFILTGLKPGHFYTITFDLEGYNTQLYNYKQWIGPNGEVIVIAMETIEEAKRRLMEEAGIDPEQVQFDIAAREHYNNAVILYKEKKFPEAYTEMEQAWENYAQVVDEEAKTDLIAIPRFYGITAYFSQNLEVAKKYVDIYLALKPDDKSIQDLKATVDRELQGPSAQERYNQAVELINKNDDAGAFKILSSIIKQDPEYGLAYFQLGKIKTREFEFEDAVKYYKGFLKREPNHKLAAEAKELIVTLSE